MLLNEHKSMIIAFSFNSNTKPVLQIDDNTHNQVSIRLIPFGDEHLTIHLQQNGTLLLTHSSQNKEPSVWDEDNIKIASALSYANPDRHGQYIHHSSLPKLDNASGYHLVGRMIDLDSFTPRVRYFNNIDQTFPVRSSKFKLTIYLSTKDNPRKSFHTTTTSLGDLCYEFEAK